MNAEEPQVGALPRQVWWAGVLVALEGLVGLGVAVAILLRAVGADALNGNLLGETGFFGLIGGAVLVAGVGLTTGRRGARTPAIVTQLLLFPVVYSLLGPSRQLLLGAVAGVYVLITFLLLISEPARRWSMGHPPDAQPPPS